MELAQDCIKFYILYGGRLHLRVYDHHQPSFSLAPSYKRLPPALPPPTENYLRNLQPLFFSPPSSADSSFPLTEPNVFKPACQTAKMKVNVAAWRNCHPSLTRVAILRVPRYKSLCWTASVRLGNLGSLWKLGNSVKRQAMGKNQRSTLEESAKLLEELGDKTKIGRESWYFCWSTFGRRRGR